MTSSSADFDRATIARHVEIARRNDDADAYTLLGDVPHKKVVIDHGWSAVAGTEVVNLATGEVTVVPEHVSYRGGDQTVGQLAKQLRMGPRETRAALFELGMLHEETEAKMLPMICDPMQTKPEYSSRHRLSEWAVKMRYGRRVRDAKGYARDWLTPAGQTYINAALALNAAMKATSNSEPAATERPKAIEVIGKLLTGDLTLRQVDIVRLTGLSKMTVHRNLRLLGRKVTSSSPSVYINESGTMVA